MPTLRRFQSEPADRSSAASSRLRALGPACAAVAGAASPEAVAERLADAARELCGASEVLVRLDGEGSIARVSPPGAGGPLEALALTPAAAALRDEAGRAALLGQPSVSASDDAGGTLAAAIIPAATSAMGGHVMLRAAGPLDEVSHAALGQLTLTASLALELCAARRAAALVAEHGLQAAAEREARLASLCHDLRTPLTAVLGWARMLRVGAVAPAQRDRALELIERNARSQAARLDDVDELCGAGPEGLPLHPTPALLSRAVEAALEGARPLAEARGVRLAVELDLRPVAVCIDTARIHRALSTLVARAIGRAQQGGCVSLTLRCEDDRAEIAVGLAHEADAEAASPPGGGLRPAPPAEPGARSAEPPMRAPPPRPHDQFDPGTGAARRVIERHGGSLEEASDGTGGFRIELPLAPLRTPTSRPPPPDLSTEPRACPPSLAGLRVLVVEDEPDARELLAMLLERWSASVRSASNASEALRLFDQETPEVLVSDIGMPGEDGHALIRRVRARPARLGGQVPALALTAFSRDEDRAHALLAGFTMHLSKPIEPRELLQALATITGRLVQGTA
jgi:CheY-like chemotaxis protein/signal transduction histidine kinase